MYVLQGSTIPLDSCAMAYNDLFGQDDECSRSAAQLLYYDNSNTSVIVSLHYGDCPTRFQTYVTECNDVFGDSSDDVSITAK